MCVCTRSHVLCRFVRSHVATEAANGVGSWREWGVYKRQNAHLADDFVQMHVNANAHKQPRCFLFIKEKQMKTQSHYLHPFTTRISDLSATVWDCKCEHLHYRHYSSSTISRNKLPKAKPITILFERMQEINHSCLFKELHVVEEVVVGGGGTFCCCHQFHLCKWNSYMAFWQESIDAFSFRPFTKKYSLTLYDI